MRKRMVLIAVLLILFIVLGCTIFYFTRPSVAFVASSSFPPGYELPEPGNILRYRMTDNIGNADLVITAPDAAVPSGSDSYLFGREAEDGESPAAVLAIDTGRMWESALPLGSAVVLYEESDPASREILSHLEEIDPDIKSVSYSGRISVANIDSVRSSIESASAEYLFALTPSTSMELLRSDHQWSVVMDVRDSAAMEATEVDYAVSIDWDATVDNLLSGNAELSYTLLTL